MSQAVAPAGVRWRLGAGTRKSVLLIHIASAGAWLGIDVVMAVLVFTAVFSDDDRTKALSFQAVELIAVWPLLITGLVCLLTGLVLISLAPEVADAAERGRQFDAGVAVPLGVGDLIFPPIVSPTALLVAMVLAVFKPWGRIRPSRGGTR